MAVIGRKFASVFMQFINCRLVRVLPRHHAGLFRHAPAFFEIARAAGSNHIFPSGAATGAARNDVVKGQIIGRAAILAGKPVAQNTLKRVKAGWRGGFT